jgi:anaerobic magnesium-protoporphyrin IX monomethyl ester cyclase
MESEYSPSESGFVQKGQSMPAYKILFAIPPYLGDKIEAIRPGKLRSFFAFPYGVLCLASYIKKATSGAHEIKINDLNQYSVAQGLAQFAEVLNEFKPDIVGISVMFDVSYKHVAGLAAAAKAANPETKVILGGAAITTAWDVILNDQPFVDALCYSEGELALVKLLDSDDLQKELLTDPWVTRQSIGAGRKPKTKTLENLNDVIAIDYSLIDTDEYGMIEAFSPFRKAKEEEVKQFFIVTSRGCPFKCVFCAEPTLHGGTMRYASLDVIEDHIKYLVDSYGMNVLTIYDDQLLLNHKRAKEFFRILAIYNLRVETPNGLTAAYIDDEMAALMKAAGMDTVQLAIESGTEHMLRNVIKKPLRLNKVAPVVELLHKHGLFVQGFFVMGIPGEREQDRIETTQFIKDVGLDWGSFSLASPIRGSELYDICVKNQYIPEKMGIGEYELGTYIIRAPGLDPETLPQKSYRMNLDVNFINNRRMRIGDYQVAARCFEDVIERYREHAFAHYFLAKAYEKIGGNDQKVQDNMRLYDAIIAKNDTWRSHADHFGLIGHLRLAAPAIAGPADAELMSA